MNILLDTKDEEQEHMRGKPVGQKMYSRGTKDEQQRYNGGTTEALHQTENTKYPYIAQLGALVNSII